MRARYPDATGTVDVDGTAIAYEVYDRDAPTLLLMPAWSIVHSRIWKAQIPFLARHWRVVCFDPRGNGASDRPTDRVAYGEAAFVGDGLAVLDATGTDAAIVVGLSRGGRWAALLAAEHPDRVLGAVLISPSIPLGPHPRFDREHFLARFDDPTGWEKWNYHHWLEDWPDFVDFFMDEVYPEPHSTRQVELGSAWGRQTDGRVAAATMTSVRTPQDYAQALQSLRCPVLVLQGDQDTITPPEWSHQVAKLTGGVFVLMEGAGHAPNTRDPVPVNRWIHDFASRVTGHTHGDVRRWRRAPRRQPKVLFLSSPIGLGHARRDMAIASELRARVDGLQVEWLTQDPVTGVLDSAGEVVHPAARWLANESAHLESEAGEHDLHCFRAFREMDEILVANFMVFQEVVDEGSYDLVIADEAWDVDHFWHENPELKRAQLAWLTDFVGFLPMPDGGAAERAVTTDYNAEMLEHVARHRWVRDRALFVGEPDDIVPATFGDGLPDIAAWTRAHFEFPGYISGFDPTSVADVDGLRHELGYGSDEKICVVTVGGSGVGGALLRRVVEAHGLARRQVPNMRTVVVAGPRIDPRSLPVREGLEVHAYVPDLYRHLAVCDLAVVQGGLTTTMELTATGRPFLYFPLQHHFEQQFHVRHRLERHRAGRAMDYATADPDAIAAAMVEELGRPTDYRPVTPDGAARAADLLAELL